MAATITTLAHEIGVVKKKKPLNVRILYNLM